MLSEVKRRFPKLAASRSTTYMDDQMETELFRAMGWFVGGLAGIAGWRRLADFRLWTHVVDPSYLGRSGVTAWIAPLLRPFWSLMRALLLAPVGRGVAETRGVGEGSGVGVIMAVR